MDKKTFFINLAVCIASYLLWIVLGLLLSSVKAVESISFLLTLPLLLAGCVFVVRNTKKILFFPLATMGVNVTVSLVGIICVVCAVSPVFDNLKTSEGIELFFSMLGSLGSAILVVILISAALIVTGVVFVFTLLTGLIAKKLLEKYQADT